jgi:hypothetical protein
MKSLYAVLFFLCLSQITNAKTITVQGQIKNFDTLEMADVRLFLFDIKKDIIIAELTNLDSLGNFQFSIERGADYRLKIYSKNYAVHNELIRFISIPRKPIQINLRKREEPLASIDRLLFDYPSIQKIKKNDSINTSIKGIIIDKTREPLMFATVAITQNGQLITGTQTDFDGKYSFKDLEEGIYDAQVSYVGFRSKTITNIEINNSTTIVLTIVMNQSVELQTIGESYSRILINYWDLTQGTTFSADEIQRTPHKN